MNPIKKENGKANEGHAGCSRMDHAAIPDSRDAVSMLLRRTSYRCRSGHPANRDAGAPRGLGGCRSLAHSSAERSSSATGG